MDTPSLEKTVVDTYDPNLWAVPRAQKIGMYCLGFMGGLGAAAFPGTSVYVHLKFNELHEQIDSYRNQNLGSTTTREEVDRFQFMALQKTLSDGYYAGLKTTAILAPVALAAVYNYHTTYANQGMRFAINLGFMTLVVTQGADIISNWKKIKLDKFP